MTGARSRSTRSTSLIWAWCPSSSRCWAARTRRRCSPMCAPNTTASSPARSAPPARARGSRRRRWRAGFPAGISPNCRPCRSVTWPRWCAHQGAAGGADAGGPGGAAGKPRHDRARLSRALTARARASRAGRASGSRWCAISAPRSPTSLMYSTSPRWGCIRTMWGGWPGLMQQLRDKGNTVLIVEHKPDMIAIADHVVDMGPLPAARAAKWSTRAISRGF